VRNVAETSSLSRSLANTETLQIAELHMLDAYCTPIEERFERITRLAARALQWPVVAITTVTQQTQWFKSVMGWDVGELAVDQSLCKRTITKARPVVVGDLQRFAQYVNHPLVTGPPNFRCYAGAPLLNAKGTVIGTFCALDFEPRNVSRSDYRTVLDLSELAQRELLTSVLHSAQASLVAKLSIARRQALLDPLTKTWNRRGGTLLLEEGIFNSKKKGASIGVLAVDIDDFKVTNDTFGHQVGDRALQMVAKELMACVRNNDGVCRFGGDEFFVVISGVDHDTIERIAARVKKRISQHLLKTNSHQDASVSVSIGITWAAASDSKTAEELIAEADRELYANKQDHSVCVEL
jgi:diguanylate cyclase (GGDEF)-like protein